MTTSLYTRIAVKVGSNVLTRNDGTLDITRMSAIVDQIATLRRNNIQVILISSGAVAAGRNELNLDQRLDYVSARQLYSAVGQAKLINRYYELFRDHGIACGQVLVTKDYFSTRRHYLNQLHCMNVMLANNVIPVVNENDTVSLTELMFTDNDELSGILASMMGAQALIILSNIDGIYTGDPSLPSSSLISDIMPGDDISRYIRASKSSLGRGGMTTKHRIATKVASEGIAVMIANGKRDDILLSLMGIGSPMPHTLFHPSTPSASGIKKWIAHSEDFSKGVINVNEGAASAICSPQRASLLLVGVTSIDGDFERDDIVSVADPDGKIIAWGKSGYSANEARAVIGDRGAKPIIHSDYMYVHASTANTQDPF